MEKNNLTFGLTQILLGVIIFAGTVPFTKLALQSFSAYEIASYRVLIGGFLSLLILAQQKKLSYLKIYKNTLWKVSMGMCFFPLLLAISLSGLPASFGGVALGLLPIATSMAAIYFLKEKVKATFFLYGLLGSGAVISYSFSALDKLTFHLPLIFFAIFICSVGYTFGGHLSKKIGGITSVALANAFSLPVALIGLYFIGLPNFDEISISSFTSLLYLAIFSQLVGFFPFYTGLAKVGVARGVQVQLLQPFLTLVFSSFLVDTSLGVLDFVVCFIVVIAVYMSTKQKEKSHEVLSAESIS